MKITTNNVPRPIIHGFELSERERAEFDYLDADALDSAPFVRFKGRVYDLGEFTRTGETLPEWHGAQGDSYFCGTLVRFCEDGDFVVMGTYFA